MSVCEVDIGQCGMGQLPDRLSNTGVEYESTTTNESEDNGASDIFFSPLSRLLSLLSLCSSVYVTGRNDHFILCFQS